MEVPGAVPVITSQTRNLLALDPTYKTFEIISGLIELAIRLMGVSAHYLSELNLILRVNLREKVNANIMSPISIFESAHYPLLFSAQAAFGPYSKQLVCGTSVTIEV